MKYINKLQPLILPSSVILGIFFARIILYIGFGIYSEQTVLVSGFLWQQLNLYTLLLVILPTLVMAMLIFQHQPLVITLKNLVTLIILSCALSLILSLLMMGLSLGMIKGLEGKISYEILRWLSFYFLPFLGMLIEPLFAPLLLWLVIALGFPVKRAKNVMPLSHGMQLLLVFCAVAFLFYWMVVIFQLSLAQFSIFKIQLSLAILIVCLIYDRVQYADIYEVNKFTKLRLVIIVILLVISIFVSILFANYLVQIYSGKYIASLIIQIFINGLMISFLTQLWIRKILYRI